MLADAQVHLGGETLLENGLATVPDLVGKQPGDSYDESLLVSPAGRKAMRATTNRVIELEMEMVRREGPDPSSLPSRLTCVFAYSTPEAAEDYLRERRAGSDSCLWRLQVSDGTSLHEADAGWLAMPRDLLSFYAGASRYWMGRRREPPVPVSLPIDIETLVPSGAPTVVGRLS